MTPGSEKLTYTNRPHIEMREYPGGEVLIGTLKIQYMTYRPFMFIGTNEHCGHFATRRARHEREAQK